MWDIKYRPLTFSDTIGQEGSVRLLKTRLKQGSGLDTSYIFAGSWGSGKTTLSRIFARATMCLDLNKEDPEPCNACDNCLAILDGTPNAFVEKDAASGGTVDIVREMIEDLPFSVMGSSKRVWLFDEAHRMTTASQDLLLLPIEEKKVVGIFCTTEVEKIRGPIRSRCEEYTIRKSPREDLLKRMQMILQKEGVRFEDDAILTVIDFSGGHVRDIINRLERIALSGDITVANVREQLNLGVVSVYYDILLGLGDAKHVLDLLEKASERSSPDEISSGLAEAAMNSYRLANGMFTDFVQVDKALAQKVYERFGPASVKIAEYFLRTKQVSKTGLTCDLLNLTQNGGSVPNPVVTVGPPVLVTSAPQTQTTAETTSLPIAKPIPTLNTPPVADSKVRPDGIGSLGKDPLAYTELDYQAVPQVFPRMRDTEESKIPFSASNTGVVDDEGKTLTADEWRREFTRTYYSAHP